MLLYLELNPSAFHSPQGSGSKEVPWLDCLFNLISTQLLTHYASAILVLSSSPVTNPFLPQGLCTSFLSCFPHCSSYNRLHLIFLVTAQRSFLWTPYCSIHCSLYPLWYYPIFPLQNPSQFVTLFPYSFLFSLPQTSFFLNSKREKPVSILTLFFMYYMPEKRHIKSI